MIDEQTEKLHDGRPKNWFWDYNTVFGSDLSVHAKIVRLYLARCASNGSRQAWPSLNNIAEHCGISRATVKRALAELLEAGWLTKETRRSNQGDFASTIYTLQAPPQSSPDKPVGGLAPVEPTLSRDDREGGGLSESLPCPDLIGVGSDRAKGRLSESQRVGSVGAYVGSGGAPNKTKDNNTKLNNTQGTSSSSEVVSSLRSDTTSGAVATLDLPEPGANPRSASPSVSPSVPETPDDGELTTREIIGALGDAFLEIAGMADRYPPGPQRKRVYALMGRLYNRLDSEPVFRAIDALTRRPDVDDPLRYVAGAAEKIAREMERRPAVSDDYVKKFYDGLKAHVLTPERRTYWEEQYRLAREEGEEILRQRQAKLDAARDLLETPRHSDDPTLEAIYELQRRGARAIIEEQNDLGGAKTIGQYARDFLEKLQGIPASPA